MMTILFQPQYANLSAVERASPPVAFPVTIYRYLHVCVNGGPSVLW